MEDKEAGKRAKIQARGKFENRKSRKTQRQEHNFEYLLRNPRLCGKWGYNFESGIQEYGRRAQKGDQIRTVCLC